MPRKHKQIGMSEPPATEVPPLQNLNLNTTLNPTEHLPAELRLMIRNKLLDSKLPGQVCAEWNAWCRFGKSTHTMCSNPDDLAWEEGCKLLGLNNKPTQNPERTWRAIFNGLCNDLFHLKDARRDISVPSNERPWVWYMWLLKERAASGTPQARGAVWLRRCAAEVLRRTPPSADGTYTHLLSSRHRSSFCVCSHSPISKTSLFLARLENTAPALLSGACALEVGLVAATGLLGAASAVISAFASRPSGLFGTAPK